MSQVDPKQEQFRLRGIYAQKSDEELISLRADFQNLTESAQAALQDELGRRELRFDEINSQPESSAAPIASGKVLLRYVRSVGLFVLNLIAAIFGTAVIEVPIGQLYYPRTINAVLLKGNLLSAACGFAIGFFVFRRWSPGMARWIGLFGVAWFILGACVDINHGSVWSRMSGMECSEGLHAGHCMNWIIFSLPAIRTVFYSAGAWVCWRLSLRGSSSIDDALLGRFKVPSHFEQR
jgi:hypothetical protein